MRDLLAPCDGPVTLTRNGTELSRFSERLVLAFLTHGASSARVRHEDTDYEMQTLYDGLRRVCGKGAYRGAVRVHKQDGAVILIREKGKR